ncbi:MAG: hypothetical protein M3296_08850, partial [Actinomycetota bacterium]|nr:hypothetical protein [Actinomycetota bacterium]
VVVHEGDARRELPHDWADDVELPPLPAMQRVAPLDADPDTGQVAGPLGGLEMLARAVRDVAGLVGGRSVVAAEYETTRPQVPLGLAGRAGEPVVVLLGDAEFALEV